jgi:hypothetical protein
MPALEKRYDISLKAKLVILFLIFIANRHRIFRLWSKIENSPECKNAGESQEYALENPQTYEVSRPLQ